MNKKPGCNKKTPGWGYQGQKRRFSWWQEPPCYG